MIYELAAKDKLIQKFDSKTNFLEVFPAGSNINSNTNNLIDSIGNLLIEGIIESKNQEGELKVNRKNSSI